MYIANLLISPGDGALFRARVKANPKANPEENSGHFEGDILLDDFIIEQILQSFASGRNAYTFPNTKWPDNTVVWEFGDGEFGKET